MIYLDYNATTPCDPDVLETMLPYFTEKFGNASSKTHAFGWVAEQAVDRAREQVANIIQAESNEIIFTSGATESCNLALKGVFERYGGKGNHIITCVTEHKAVLDTCAYLERKGAEVTYLPVNTEGLIDLEDLERAIKENTILIAIMYANNETGVLQPIAQIGALAKKKKVLFFCDATQAIGKVPVTIHENGIDLLALSGHKIYGPKGVGALFVRRRNPRVSLSEQIHGGSQQRSLRSGTLNVPGIVGLGKACAILMEKSFEEQARFVQFREILENYFLQEKDVLIQSQKSERTPNVLNISFQGIDAQRLVAALNHQIAFSLGSACTAALQGPSHVLTAMNLEETIIKGAFRISYGRMTTLEEINQAKVKILNAVRKLKSEVK